MKAGKVSIRITNVLIQGEAGVGKTSTLSLLLEESPPTTRHSTSLATHPHQRVVHYQNKVDDMTDTHKHLRRNFTDSSPTTQCPRHVSGPLKVQSDESDGKWRNVELKKIIKEMVSIYEVKKNLDSVIHKEVPCSSKQPKPKTKLFSNFHHVKKTPNSSSSGNQKVVTNLQDEIVGLLSAERNPAEVLGSHWIYIVDSGGQPHFHNLLPHFVHGLSVALFVVCLSEPLDHHRLVEYYKDGKPISTPFESHYTTEENLKFLTRSIQSHTLNGTKPNLIFIGTFLDQLKDPDATLPKIDDKILSLIQSECIDQLIFCDGGLNKLIFPLNAQSPGPNEMRIADLLRKQIQRAPSHKIVVPIMWYVLELTLKELSKQKNRLVLSRKECTDIAKMHNIGKNELVGALKYFHEHHIFHYYDVILPNVVFTSTQVLLDKLTELIKEAYRMRDMVVSLCSVDPRSGKWQKFKNQGIVTLEFLEDKCFSAHYVTGIFSPSDLLEVFIEHLIITPYSIISKKINSNSRDAQYFMPSLLKMLPLNEIDKHRVYNGIISPLLIRFQNGWPRAGVFCCLQVFLIQQLKWKILEKNRSMPILVAQNCVMLSPPKSSARVTLIDSFAYIEVHLDSSKISKKTCDLIRTNIYLGISKACKTLRYKEETLELSFFCPCTVTSVSSASSFSSDSVNLHWGEYLEDDCCIRCTIDQSKCTYIEARSEYTVWLERTELKGKTQHEFPLELESAPETHPLIDSARPVSTQQVDVSVSSSSSRCPILSSASQGLTLTMSDAMKVFEYLVKARESWYFIGVGLGYEHSDLDSIENAYPTDERRCFEMLKRRIRQGGLTRSMLCDSLRGKFVQRDDVAKEIEAISLS